MERALSPLLPQPEIPFAVRVDMDILSNDGSAAETAVNSAVLALKNAKVPVAAHVAGKALQQPSALFRSVYIHLLRPVFIT